MKLRCFSFHCPPTSRIVPPCAVKQEDAAAARSRAQQQGCAAGIFLPSLSVGAAWGRLLGMLVQAASDRFGWGVKISLPAYSVSTLPHQTCLSIAVGKICEAQFSRHKCSP